MTDEEFKADLSEEGKKLFEGLREHGWAMTANYENGRPTNHLARVQMGLEEFDPEKLMADKPISGQ